MTRTTRTLALLAGAALLGQVTLGGTAASAAAPHVGDIRKGHQRVLIVKYQAREDCVVVPNYPRGTTKGRKVVPKGQAINWRYNIGKRAAAVSIPGEKKRAGGGFPWWGFVQDRSCLGPSIRTVGHYERWNGKKWVKKKAVYPAGRAVPKRTLQGRSQFKNGSKGYFRAVDWRPSHGKVPSRKHPMTNTSTLRDRPNRFVIGNVYKGWTVRVSSTKPGWHKAYVPAIKRWGYVQIR